MDILAAYTARIVHFIKLMNFVVTIDAVLLIFLFYNIILFDVNKS